MPVLASATQCHPVPCFGSSLTCLLRLLVLRRCAIYAFLHLPTDPSDRKLRTCTISSSTPLIFLLSRFLGLSFAPSSFGSPSFDNKPGPRGSPIMICPSCVFRRIIIDIAHRYGAHIYYLENIYKSRTLPIRVPVYLRLNWLILPR